MGWGEPGRGRPVGKILDDGHPFRQQRAIVEFKRGAYPLAVTAAA
jgi:hypothetical protein